MSVSDLFMNIAWSWDNASVDYSPYAITKITITGGEIIPQYAFSGMTTLKEIDLSNTKATILGTFSFSACRSLEKITLPSSIKSINSYAFSNCTALEHIELNNGLREIGEYAFCDCSSLSKINYIGIIDKWTQINFDNCYSNPLSYVGNLYINDELVTNVVLTNTTKINSYAFYNCKSLTSITIPNSVTSIEQFAFFYCSSLTSINYNGTKSEWQNIYKGYDWNHNTGKYTIYCSDGTIIK